MLQHDPLKSYLNILPSKQQLTHLEFLQLFGEMAKESNTDKKLKIRNKLLECNLRLVVSIAKKYKKSTLPLLELIQEGNLGLITALEKFDPSENCTFSTYATYWINQFIGQFIQKRKRIIRLPAHAVTVQQKIYQETEKAKQLGYKLSQQQLQDLCGASETVTKATILASQDAISIHSEIRSKVLGHTLSVEDVLEDVSPGANPLTNCSDVEIIDIVRKILKVLPAKESAILRLRCGLYEDEHNHKDFPITTQEMENILNNGEGMKD